MGIRLKYVCCSQPRLKRLNNNSLRALTSRWMITHLYQADGARVWYPNGGGYNSLRSVVDTATRVIPIFRLSFALPCC